MGSSWWHHRSVRWLVTNYVKDLVLFAHTRWGASECKALWNSKRSVDHCGEVRSKLASGRKDDQGTARSRPLMQKANAST